MIVVNAASALPHEELLRRAEALDAALVEPEKVRSLEELRLAEHLANKSFASGTNVAKRMKYEFLLWLSGKTDLKSAFREMNPKGGEFLLVVFSGEDSGGKDDVRKALERLEAKERPLKLAEKAEPLELERISLSRLGS